MRDLHFRWSFLLVSCQPKGEEIHHENGRPCRPAPIDLAAPGGGVKRLPGVNRSNEAGGGLEGGRSPRVAGPCGKHVL